MSFAQKPHYPPTNNMNMDIQHTTYDDNHRSTSPELHSRFSSWYTDSSDSRHYQAGIFPVSAKRTVSKLSTLISAYRELPDSESGVLWSMYKAHRESKRAKSEEMKLNADKKPHRTFLEFLRDCIDAYKAAPPSECGALWALYKEYKKAKGKATVGEVAKRQVISYPFPDVRTATPLRYSPPLRTKRLVETQVPEESRVIQRGRETSFGDFVSLPALTDVEASSPHARVQCLRKAYHIPGKPSAADTEASSPQRICRFCARRRTSQELCYVCAADSPSPLRLSNNGGVSRPSRPLRQIPKAEIAVPPLAPRPSKGSRSALRLEISIPPPDARLPKAKGPTARSERPEFPLTKILKPLPAPPREEKTPSPAHNETLLPLTYHPSAPEVSGFAGKPSQELTSPYSQAKLPSFDGRSRSSSQPRKQKGKTAFTQDLREYQALCNGPQPSAWPPPSPVPVEVSNRRRLQKQRPPSQEDKSANKTGRNSVDKRTTSFYGFYNEILPAEGEPF